MDFWARTDGLQQALCISEGSSSWHCSFYFHGEQDDFFQICRNSVYETSPSTPTVAELEVGKCEDWKPCLDWLASTLNSHPVDRDPTQQDWWASNGLAYRLLDLPLELRECIYRHVNGPNLWPHLQKIPRGNHSPGQTINYFDPSRINKKDPLWNSTIGTSQLHLDPSDNRPPQPTALVRTCKQVKHEFCHYTEFGTIRHFQEYHTLYYMNRTGLSMHLRRISLGFPTSIFFGFLGCAGEFAIQRLSEIPTLCDLKFHFQIDPTGKGPLWRGTGCQKTNVDYFLTLAFAYIRHIPHITISGHVKNSIRAKWEIILQDERNGVQHDMSAQVQWIFSTRLDPTGVVL
jgi:hypothetical protein